MNSSPKTAFWLRYLGFAFKRALKKAVNWLLLILFPLITFFFLQSSDGETRLTVALYTEAHNGFSMNLTEKLAQRNGIFQFYISESEEALYRDVASGHAECGYIFPEDLSDQLNEGRKKNLVNLVVSTSTTMSGLTNEIVYSELFEEYSLLILEDYLLHDSALDSADTALVETLYHKYLTNGSTFGFDFTGAYQDYTSVKKGITLHTITGIAGILILLGGLSGLFQYASDDKKHIYANIPAAVKNKMALIQVACPLFLFLAAGAVCLLLTGYFYTPVQILKYTVYGALILLLCMLLKPLLRCRLVLLACLPLYLLGCLIFTPVFIDLTLYVPKLAFLSRFFVTWYLF